MILEDIIKLMQKQPDFYAMKGASEDDIKMAEQTLGLHFAADYRKYIAAFGVASFAGHELTGACKSKRLSVVDVTIEERGNITVPANWYVLEQANIDPDTRVYLSWGSEEGHGTKEYPRSDSRDDMTRRNSGLAARLELKGATVRLYCQQGGRHCEADWEKQVPLFMNFLWMNR